MCDRGHAGASVRASAVPLVIPSDEADTCQSSGAEAAVARNDECLAEVDAAAVVGPRQRSSVVASIILGNRQRLMMAHTSVCAPAPGIDLSGPLPRDIRSPTPCDALAA